MTLDIQLIALVIGLLVAVSYLYGFWRGQVTERRAKTGKWIGPKGKAKKNGKRKV